MKSFKPVIESYLLFFLLQGTAIIIKAGNFILPLQWRMSINSPAVIAVKWLTIEVLVLNLIAIIRFVFVLKKSINRRSLEKFFKSYNLEAMLWMNLFINLSRMFNAFFTYMKRDPFEWKNGIELIVLTYGEVLRSVYNRSFGLYTEKLITLLGLILFLYFILKSNNKKPS